MFGEEEYDLNSCHYSVSMMAAIVLPQKTIYTNMQIK